jgi:hypothetical protein
MEDNKNAALLLPYVLLRIRLIFFTFAGVAKTKTIARCSHYRGKEE